MVYNYPVDMNQTPDKAPGRGIRAILRLPLVTMGLWVVLGAIGFVFLPSVEHVVASQSNANLPKDAPTLQALTTMDDAFGTGKARAFVFVVFENNDKLTDADQAAYTRLFQRFTDTTDPKASEYVAEVQSYVTPQVTPAATTAPAKGTKAAAKPKPVTINVDGKTYVVDTDKKGALTSEDGQATYLPVGLTADFGSAASNDQVEWVRDEIKDVNNESSNAAKIYVTGDPANLIDMTKLATSANQISGIVSMVLLFVILLIIYRRFASIFVPLITIGIATLCTLSVLSLAGQAGMGLSTYTESFCVAIVLGAGTDYSIFLISRFREEYARTGDVYSAVSQAMIKIGPALLASAGTVAISSMVLNFTQLAVFSTTGPAMAVAVGTTVLIAMTVTPALLLLVGKRIGPQPVAPATSFWNRVGDYVATKPARILLAGTAMLLLLTAFVPTVELGYSEHPADPKATEAATGQEVLDDHFGKYTTQPDYVLINAKGLTTATGAPVDLHDFEYIDRILGASRVISQIDGVAKVSSATRPDGSEIKELTIADQVGKVGEELDTAADKIKNGQGDLVDLKDGTASLASGADRQAAGMRQATNAMPRLISGLNQLASGSNRSAAGARRLAGGAEDIRAGLRDLANGLQQTRSGLSQSTSGIGQVVQALNQDPYCNQSPICPQARAALANIYQGQRDRMVPGLSRAANAANQLASGQSKVSDGLRNLAAGLNQSAGGAYSIAGGQRSLYGGMSQLASGSQQIANGLDKLPSGIREIVDNTIKLGDGLSQTGDFLSDVSQQSSSQEAGGFYIPPDVLDSAAYKESQTPFISPDGSVARIQILGKTSPSGSEGLDRFDTIQERVKDSLRGTSLEGAKIQMTGASGGTADLRHYFKQDFKLALIAVLLTVLILMMIVLRSLIAPLYLLISVILSYGAALGATVILFHLILGQDMPFNVPVLSFVLLVAVGADYNILLMSRMRESKGRLTPRAVGQAVTATGPVITSAGIIFASAFLPMVASTLSAVAQLCFTVTVGLLLDTFVVRTLIVPACAVLLGDKSWWPGRSEIEGPGSAAVAGSGFSLPKPKVLAPPIMTADTL